MVKVDTPLCDDYVGFRIANTRAPKKAVMKPRVPRKARPRRLMLSGANIDSCRFRRLMVVT